MGLLITGIILVVLPILTWFSLGFVEAAGTTLFFWAIGVPMVIVGADKMKPEGLWAAEKKPPKPPKGHFARTYQFDNDGNITGATEQWIKD